MSFWTNISSYIDQLKQRVASCRMTQVDLTQVDSWTSHENLVSEVFGNITATWAESVLPNQLNSALLGLIETLPPIDLERRLTEPLDPNLLLGQHSRKIIDSFLLSYTAYELPIDSTVVIDIQNWIVGTFQDRINSPVTFINSRAWITNGQAKLGPFDWHTDGFKPGHLKVMIYPDGLSEIKGGLEIGDSLIMNRPPGASILFRNSDVKHRAIPASGGRRLVVEITLQRSLIPQMQRYPSHFNGSHLKEIRKLYRNFEDL